MLDDVQTIVADVDPRRDNQPAVQRARALAEQCGATVHLVVCEYINTLAGGMFFDNRRFQHSRAEYVENLEQWLAGSVDKLRDAGVEATGRVLWGNPRADALLEAADEAGADVLIRSATRHSRLDRVMLGATDWELIRRAPMTLWLAKNGQPDGAGFRLVAAIDPTHDADEEASLDQRLLSTADRLCRLFSGDLHVLHAFLPMSTGPVVAPGAAMATAAAPVPRMDRELLESLRASLTERVHALTREFGVPDERVHVLEGETADVVREFVEEHGINAVVAGAVSRGWLKRLIVGNTAERLLQSVDCDMIVVKPEGFVAD